MAFSVSRLYRKFCTQIESSPPLPFRNRVSNLFKEQNLSKLVSDFKQLSEISQFRCKHLIYEHVINRLASAKQFSEIESLIEHHRNYQDITHEGFTSRLISLYGKAGMYDHAYRLFDEMPKLNCERTVKSFNSLLQACNHCKEFTMVEKLFRELPLELGINVDTRSYNALARALCEMKSFDKVDLLMNEMESEGLKPDLVTYNMIMYGYYCDGRYDDGEKIWNKMEKSGIVPDMVSYNSKLGGLIRQRKIGEVQELLKEMKSRGKEPNTITYNTLITWFCNEGELDKAKAIYDCLVKEGCAPNTGTFRELIPCICKTGDFELVAKIRDGSEAVLRFIDVHILQKVVNGLVKESKVEEAEKLVEIIQSKSKGRSMLQMPTKVE